MRSKARRCFPRSRQRVQYDRGAPVRNHIDSSARAESESQGGENVVLVHVAESKQSAIPSVHVRRGRHELTAATLTKIKDMMLAILISKNLILIEEEQKEVKDLTRNKYETTCFQRL